MTKTRKAIILAGGNGSRLYPSTIPVSKQLMAIYDKPMIFYPMSTIMLAGIRTVLIICKSNDKPNFLKLFGDGSNLGMSIEYAIQDQPNGLAEAMLIGETFLDGAPSILILGDNIFYGAQLSKKLMDSSKNVEGSEIFLVQVGDPQNFGVVELHESGSVLSIEEKPVNPKSNLISTGIYFFDEKASHYAKRVKPSARGELEITSLLEIYVDNKELRAQNLGRGFTWMDTGTADNLLQAGNFVRSIQESQQIVISCLEEIAFKKGWINLQQLKEQAKKYSKTNYGKYIERIVRENDGV